VTRKQTKPTFTTPARAILLCAPMRTVLAIALPALSLTLLVSASVGCVGGSTPYPPAATGSSDLGPSRRDAGVATPSSDLGAAADFGRSVTDADGGFFEAADGAALDAGLTDAQAEDADIADASVTDAAAADADMTDAAAVTDAEVDAADADRASAP